MSTGAPASDRTAGEWIDISVSLDAAIPTWPTSAGATTTRVRDLRRGDPVTETRLSMDVHTGTHVDAPAHVLLDGAPVGAFGLDTFIGPALVVDVTGVPVITGEVVAKAVPSGTERVLFRTDNSARRLMRTDRFDPDFVALDVSGAQALAARPELVLVGNDYLSIQVYGGDDETHRALLRRRIAALEGLDLADLEPGPYDLVAVPLRIDSAEASPLRAVVRHTGH